MCVAAFVAAWASPSAHAEKQRRAVVLPVETIGRMRNLPRWQMEFQGQLEDELRNAGFALPSERASRVCRDLDGRPDVSCMAAVADTMHVDLVVGARVVNDGHAPPNFFVRVWLYDVHKAGDLRAEVEHKYENGTEADAAQALAKQLGEALSPPPIKQPEVMPEAAHPLIPDHPHQVAGPRIAQNPVIVDRPRFGLSRKQQWALRVSGLLAVGLGAGFISEGIVLGRHDKDSVGANGEKNCGAMCNYYGRTRTSTAVFASIGAVSALAGIGMIVVGVLPPKKVMLTPEVSTTGGGLSLTVKF